MIFVKLNIASRNVGLALKAKVLVLDSVTVVWTKAGDQVSETLHFDTFQVQVESADGRKSLEYGTTATDPSIQLMEMRSAYNLEGSDSS